MPRFVDTNVLLYAYVDDDPAKKASAKEVLGSRDLVLSAQVLAEFYTQAVRPTRSGRLGADDAREMITALTRYPIEPISSVLVLSAVRASTRFQLSYWDAAIIEAARAAGCGEVLSEDLNDGQDYDGVRVVNPFVG